MNLASKLFRMDGRLLGGAMVPVVGLVATALAQPDPGSGFDCVIGISPQVCQSCSDCTITGMPPVITCGTVKASAGCIEPLIAHCWIEVIEDESHYFAECIVAE